MPNLMLTLLRLSGLQACPVSLECSFFGRKIKNPFLLSASPLSDGFDQIARAYKCGWAGAVIKTAFSCEMDVQDNPAIHIPDQYMCR